MNPTHFRAVKDKPRVFIVSDISNEPDDAESLCRYLLYSNELDTRGLVACTSNWMKRVVHPEDMEKIIRAYAKVVKNLNKHVHPDNQYPPAEHFLDVLNTGPALYGKEALKTDVPLSDGAKLLIERLEESDKPLWVLCWGGTNVLAQALQEISKIRSEEEAASLRSRMRVYAISDQDDTGAWIRLTFPDIFYIVSIHGWNQYGMAAWTGISGDRFYNFDQGGPDFSKFERAWLKEHVQIGALGEAYPDYMFIPEGDTPTFLYLIQNGLGVPERPDYGSWGGRYSASDLHGRQFGDTVDRVEGKDGKTYTSNHATIWRWRDAFQNDFAARIQWTLHDTPSKCNHQPIAVVNGHAEVAPLQLEAEAGAEIVLDASESHDPDGDELGFSWYQYKDVTATQWWVDAEVADCSITPQDDAKAGRVVKIQLPPPEKCAVDMFTREPVAVGQQLHFILEVTDNGTPPMKTYKRVIVQITNTDLRGKSEKSGAQSIADVSVAFDA